MALNFISVKNRKRISVGLFILAIAFLIPPSFPFGEIFSDLFLNLPLATFIANKTNFSLMTSFLITYTLVPLILIYLSALIAPTDTTKTFNGQFTKIKNFFIKNINLVKQKPIYLVWLLLSLVIVYKILSFYSTQINIYVIK